MIDRIEFAYFRIRNELGEQEAPIKKIRTAAGKLAIQEASKGPITLGRIANTKRDLKKGQTLAYFIESDFGIGQNARQLWMPIPGSSLDNIREIIPTSVPSSDKVTAWERAKIIAKNTEGYSKYDENGEALFEEARYLLAYAGANDESFGIEIQEGKISDLPVNEQLAVREAIEFGPFSSGQEPRENK